MRRPADPPPPHEADPGPCAAARFRDQAVPALDASYRLARALTRDPTQAADLVQETYLRAWRYFASFRGEQDIRAWLAGIMRNVWRDQPRRDLIPLDAAMALADPSPDPEARAIAADRAQHLRQAIAALPEPLRETLELREFTGLSYAAIAAATGVPAGTVMSRLARARAILRETVPR